MRRALAWTLLALTAALPARAQLLSPGPLTSAHASLEGLRNCTQCHTLGQRGVDPARCLSCHTPIRDRIRDRRGLHGRQASRDCGSCHSDHHGRAFDPDRFDTQTFNHNRTGYELVGGHRDVTCRSCHRPALITDAAVRRHVTPSGRLAETYLGVATECQTCHVRENPHGAALTRQSCQTCHTPVGWNRVARFDHAQTGMRLTGAHASAACTSCHGAEGRGAARFQNIPTACESCHARDNPHGQQFRGQTCASCHTTARWSEAASFNHARTAFPLAGAHASVACTSCHGSGRAARFAGTATRCQSCHERDNPHGTQFAGRACDTCHGPTTWTSAPQFSHARTNFPLVGRHASVACAGCHTGRPTAFVGVAHATCQSCHEDAHDGALGADCQTCHTPAGWTRFGEGGAAALAQRFDHEQHTGFALVGAHAGADCASCHGTGGERSGFARRDPHFQIALAGSPDGASFPALATDGSCLSCHVDAHGGRMADLPGGADCASCHTQTAFAPTTFDRARHDRDTDFALVGAHAVVPCSACHTTPSGATTPAFGLAASCQSCHADDSPHGSQFAGRDGQTACADCHATDGWSAAAFDHAARTDFALTGAHASAACQSCHARPADGPWTFAGLDATCASCHGSDSPLGARAANPHGDQFDGPGGRADCAACHDTDAFTLAHFDHEQTRFPLAGAHATVACASCHRPERQPDGRQIVRFRPLATACADCHTGR